jgi:hypothetical protein
MEVRDHLHGPTILTLEKEGPRTHWIGDCAHSKAGLDVIAKRKIMHPLGIEHWS